MKTIHHDPVIEEIRETRRKISEECDHDPAKVVAHYLKYQEQFRDRLTSTPTKSGVVLIDEIDAVIATQTK